MPDISALKSRFDLRKLVPYKVSKEYGQYRVQDCLWHTDTNPSLLVYPGFYKCLSCGKRGDIITWVRESRGLGFYAALEYLEKQEHTEPVYSPKEINIKPLDPAIALNLHFNLTESTLSYFTFRGISKENIVRFQLGYSPMRGGSFTIPIFVEGKLINIKYRRNDMCTICGSYATKEENHSLLCVCSHTWKPSGPKYYGVKNRSDATLFTSPLALASDILVYCEGEFDVIASYQAGIPAVCSTSGALSLPRRHLQSLEGKKIVAVFDNDSAGLQGRKALKSVFPDVVDLFLPVDTKGDVSDYLKNHTEDEYRKIVNSSVRELKIRKQFSLLRGRS